MPESQIASGNNIFAEADRAIGKARAAKPEMMRIAKRWAKSVGGIVIENEHNIKSKESIIRKAVKDGKSPSQLKDVLRTTVVVQADRMENAISLAKLEAGKGNSDFKIQQGRSYFGYVGAKFNAKAKNGTWYEIQIQTPEMIYAKDSIGTARRILGNDEMIRIFRERGMNGAGLGHKLYNQIRVLPWDSKEAKKLIRQSIEYYSNFKQ